MSTNDEPPDPYEDQRWRPSPEDEAFIAEQSARWEADKERHLRLVQEVSDVDDEATGAAIEYLLPALDWRALFAEDDQGEEWILQPLVAAGRMVALYSAPKAGKSLLALEAAVAISRGYPALGSPKPARPYRVLYVDFENDPRGDVRRRLEDMGYDADLVNAGALDNLSYLSFPTMAKLDTPQGGGELHAAAMHYGSEVVIIDTVSRTVAGEENDNNTWLSFYKYTGIPLKRAGIACLRLDHSGKDAEKGMRGGSAKYGDVDAVWKLVAESQSVLTLECTDHRMPVERDRLVLVRESEDVLYHRSADGGYKAVLDAREKRILADLHALGLPIETTKNDLYRALQKAGKGGKKSTVMKVADVWREEVEQALEQGPEQASTTPSETSSEAADSGSGTDGNRGSRPAIPAVPQAPPRKGGLGTGDGDRFRFPAEPPSTGGTAGRTACTNPAHSPRRIGGFWICPDCAETEE